MSVEVERQIIAAHQEQVLSVRGAAQSIVETIWDALGGYNRADVPVFIQLAEPVVAAAQERVAALVRAYVAVLAAEVTGSAASSAEAAQTAAGAGAYLTEQVRNGATFQQVYERPFIQVWKHLKDGGGFSEAVLSGRERLGVAVDNDVSLAARASARDAMGSDRRIVGYRRVLSGLGSCRFCAVISTRTFRTDKLNPLHTHCRCSIAPIWGTDDPGVVWNRDLLRALRSDVKRHDYWNEHGFVDNEGNPVANVKKIQDANTDVVVKEHSELGPVIVNADHHFAGADF